MCYFVIYVIKKIKLTNIVYEFDRQQKLFLNVLKKKIKKMQNFTILIFDFIVKCV